MNSLIVDAQKSSPHIHFDHLTHQLVISGHSYPENAAQFYHPVLTWITDYFKQAPLTQRTTFDITLIYFNTSTSKSLLDLFDLLESETQKGREILLNWYYHEENDLALECG